MTGTADLMTSAEASRVLGVSVRQVQRLTDRGMIEKVGQVGRAALLDASSVQRVRKTGVARGRQWNEATVWAALALLDGRTEIADFGSSRRWHLRDRLRRIRADDLVRAARSRAKVVRYRVSASYLDRLGDDLTRTGASALSVDVALARAFSLSGGRADTIDGYAGAERVRGLEKEYFLVRAPNGNATIRVTAAEQHQGATASLATVALDLAESLDPRERAAGLRALNRLLRRL